MSDTFDTAMRYRSNIITYEMLAELADAQYDVDPKPATVAIVFAFAGEHKPEFAIATDHSNIRSLKKDLTTLLNYGDPIGVVAVSRALGISWTPNCDGDESEITRRCI